MASKGNFSLTVVFSVPEDSPYSYSYFKDPDLTSHLPPLAPQYIPPNCQNNLPAKSHLRLIINNAQTDLPTETFSSVF